MSDKLVTLAIRTYPRAQKIKAVLEKNGIETMIHNLNLEKPEMAVGVRVRIKESDLPRALKIVEEIEHEWDKENKNPAKRRPLILVPVDFSDMVEQTIDYSFSFAQQLNTEILFLNIYFSPAFTISGNNEISTYSISDGELLRRTVESANINIHNMETSIRKRIHSGELPDVPFRFELKEGVPEDEILDYCKKYKPALVVMGTRGKTISAELIGSVTAEVMEFTQSPVFAIPTYVKINKPEKIRKIAFLTNFDQKDLISIDKTLELFRTQEVEVHFIHASEKSEAWNEVMLEGIKTYFSNHYPHIKTEYAVIEKSNSAEPIDNYLKNKNIDLLAFNSRKRRLFSRLFNPGLAYKLVLQSETMLFVTHV